MLNQVFDSMVVVIMILCFFALSANMSANIYEQTKEIGILRAIGFKRFRIVNLYLYEAIVLVFSSSLLGMLVGMIVSYVFVLQNCLIDQ